MSESYSWSQSKVYYVHDDHGGLRYANPPYEKWRKQSSPDEVKRNPG
ncbi:MAG: hypothetical protein GY820_34090 [Gammaproteobacteria bacterium]|nr:hypothetical protein [Gammaproteobacteria bacterium]